ncbi:Anti-anti-sigma regulatory factor (antagonist of anti-sigma factor) [gamma proteobacterium IMCC2047]|nr:Anti-anti-sigma regulatory factor (antagonist of anti-sigma factor) [gamma proteobacterium IMCC2047]
MNSGKILVAKNNGVYVLKLNGDVRLTLCAALDIFLEKMIAEPDLQAVFIDLSDTVGIDSTSLGFLAKISILTQKTYAWKPTIIATSDDITRLLLSMSFDQVFNIIDERIDEAVDLGELPEIEASEQDTKQQVIEAHKILMGLSDDNKAKFQELVSMLESS